MMSGLPQPTSHGSPPGPPVELLSSLTTSIQTSLNQYENAKTPAEKAAALKAIQASSNKLSRLTSSINEQWVELCQRPFVNVVVRIALEMGLFEAIPKRSTLKKSSSSVSPESSEHSNSSRSPTHHLASYPIDTRPSLNSS
jgi:aryl-alcohol dehydrogenase-like predicted oxidoreductase